MKLLHLYYDLMDLYGEYGNVVVLKKHLEDQGFEVKLDKKTVGEDIVFSDYDFIYCSSGTEANELLVLEDLLKRKDGFLRAVSEGRVILFTGGAMELLGKRIDDREALGLVDIEAVFTDKRYTGDVIVENEDTGEVVGFINKCSLIKEKEEDALFRYVFRQNEIEDNPFEGYRYRNVFGTHIIGPVLVKNPGFMKLIVRLLGGKDFRYKEISYPYEEDSYRVTLNALKERKSR